jgi:hypothetical protein
MPYAPTVNDNSGQILAEFQTNAAQINAQAMSQLGQDIGSAIASIGGIYAKGKAQTAEGKAFKEFMGVAGKNLGFTNEDLQFFKDMPDQEAYQMSNVAAPMLPSMFNAALYQKRASNQIGLANQNAANQAALRQPPANQVVTPATSPSSPNWFDLVPNR